MYDDGYTYIPPGKDNCAAYPYEAMLTIKRWYPFMESLLTDSEVNYEGLQLQHFTAKCRHVIVFIAMLYLAFIYLGPKIMKNREPFQLKKTVKMWNFTMFLFSFIGTTRVLPGLFHLWSQSSLVGLLCQPVPFQVGIGPVSLWLQLFVHSKVIELIDTVFLVLRKRELIFLHWYHHVTVLLYCLDSCIREQPAAILFASMNYLVHTVMYFYYFMASVLQRRLSWAPIVTVLQISQMFAGVYITGLALYLSFTRPLPNMVNFKDLQSPHTSGCSLDRLNLFYACLMYSTYLFLFVKFFIDKYCRKHQKKVRTKTE